MLTRVDTAVHSCNCAVSCPRLHRPHHLSSSTRPCVKPQHQHRLCSFSSQLSDPASVNQYDSRSAEEARSASRDNLELNQLARMMPDPAEDELFDDRDPAEFSNADERQLLQRQGLSSNLLLDGNNYSNGYVDDYRHGYGESDFGYSDANLAEDDLSTASEVLAVDMTQLDYHVEAKRRWEKRKAESRAFDLFHQQGTSQVNIYAQTHAMAHIMAAIEAHDKVEGREPIPIPAWIRAHFTLDACWSQFAEFMQETEARVAVRPATIEGQAEKSIEDEARTLLAEGNFFASAPPLGSSPKTLLSKQGSAAHSDQVDDVDQFIADLPGAEVKEETDSMISRLMGVEEDTEDS